MRKCSNCNITLADKDLFCPNCGMATEEIAETEQPAGAAEAAQTAGQAEPAGEAGYVNPAAQASAEKKKKKKTGLVIGVIAALLIIGAAALFFIMNGGKNKPMARFYNAQTQLLRAGAKKEDALEEFLRGNAEVGLNRKNPAEEVLSTGGSIRLNVAGLDEMSTKLLTALSIDFGVDGKVFGASVGYKGSPLMNLTGVELDDGRLGLYCPELADDYYVLDRSLLIDLGGESEAIFTPVEDISAAYDDIMARYGNIIRLGFAEEDFSEGEPMTTLENLGFGLDGAKTIVFRPNEERIKTMLIALGEEMSKDDTLANYVMSLVERYWGRDYVNSWFGVDAGEEDFASNIRKAGVELKEKAASYAKKLIETGFEWKCVVQAGKTVAEYITGEGYEFILESPAEGKNYLRLRYDARDLVETIKVDLDSADGIYSGKVDIDVKYEYNKVHITGDISGLEPERKSAFRLPYCGAVLHVTADTTSGSVSEDISITIGEGAEGGTEHVIKIDNIVSGIDGAETLPESAEIIIATTDQKPDVKAPELEPHVIESREELEEVLEGVRENLSMVMYRLMLSLMF